MHHVQLVVVEHLVRRRGVAQVFLLQGHGIAVQRLVALHLVTPRIATLQVVPQTAGRDHPGHLFLEAGRVSVEVFETGHCSRSTGERGRQST
ncbi:hypothetical protein D3C72_2158530 [compost metagenome]